MAGLFIILATTWMTACDSQAAERTQVDMRERVRVILERSAIEELKALGPGAIPALARTYRQGEHRAHILPLLVEAATPEARRALEEALLTESNNDEVYRIAHALGQIASTDSRPVLQRKLRSYGRSPDPTAIIFGGSSDVAQLTLIAALARLEGNKFGPNEDHVWRGENIQRCLTWWRQNSPKYQDSEQP